MKAQYDYQKRVVSLDNLIAMCSRISGTCHHFRVDETGTGRVRVTYSNPDEYGNSRYPITAHFPSYPGPDGSRSIVLDAVRYTAGQRFIDDESWQAFQALFDCPVLWRNPQTDTWQTEYEIRVVQHPEFAVRSEWDKGGCIQTWFVGKSTGESHSLSFGCYQDAQAKAVELMKEWDRVAVASVK